jgi:hypothetical protein
VAPVKFSRGGVILRDASLCDAPQDEVLGWPLDPHGEERGDAARLEP